MEMKTRLAGRAWILPFSALSGGQAFVSLGYQSSRAGVWGLVVRAIRNAPFAKIASL